MVKVVVCDPGLTGAVKKCIFSGRGHDLLVPGTKYDSILSAEGGSSDRLYMEVEAATLSAEDFQMGSLFGETTRICVTQNLTDVSEEIMDAASVSSEDLFVIVEKVEKNRKVYKKLKTRNEVVEFAFPTPAEAERLVEKTVLVRWEDGAARELVRRTGFGSDESVLLGTLFSEAKKYAGMENVPVELVRSVTEENACVSVFAITDAIFAGNAERAWNLYEQMASRKDYSFLKFCGAVAQRYRVLYKVAVLKERGETASRIRDIIGVKYLPNDAHGREWCVRGKQEVFYCRNTFKEVSLDEASAGRILIGRLLAL